MPSGHRSLMTDNVSSTPWTELDEEGTNLTVDAFLTTLMSQVGNALRRTLTVPYAEQFGLTVSEWRVLSLIAHAGRIAFGELVIQSNRNTHGVLLSINHAASRVFRMDAHNCILALLAHQARFLSIKGAQVLVNFNTGR